MRVLQVYRDYFTDLPGGIERHVYELAHGLGGDIRCDVLASARQRRSSVQHDGGVTIHLAAEFGRAQGIPLCPRFPRVIRSGYELVHIHCPNPTGEASLLFAGSGPARVATYHASTERAAALAPVYNRFLHRVLSSCDRVVASSERLIAQTPLLASLQSTRPERVVVVPLGVDTARFRPEEDARVEQLRASWGSGPFVLFLGRLRYYKGLPVLIEALRSVDARLVVVGDGLERERVVGLAVGALGARFTYLSHASEEELPSLYRAADVFCLPSTSGAEAFGVAALEAMACGKPVITTEVGTATSVINQDGVTGFVVPPGDPPALASAIRKVLEDRDLAQRLGDAARARVERDYSRDLMLQRIAQMYRDVMAERQKR